MKKLFIIFIISSFLLTAGEHESSTGGIAPEVYLLQLSVGFSFFPLILSDGLVEQSIESGKDRTAINNQYKQLEKLIAQENIRAKDVFTDEQIQFFALEADDEISFDKTKLGILVSSSDKTLFIVPSEIKYTGLSVRNMR